MRTINGRLSKSTERERERNCDVDCPHWLKKDKKSIQKYKPGNNLLRLQVPGILFVL